MKKIVYFITGLILSLTLGLSCAMAADDFTVSQVEAMLQSIDTLQQMQNKRNSYTASGHYDITTTNTTVINRHTKARNNYETYLADMFAKRAEAQTAYDSLTDAEKAQIDSALTAKLSNELSTVWNAGEFPVTPRDDEYSYETVNGGAGYAYEVGNYMVSGKYTEDGKAKRSNQIPQTFILVDTSDGKTSWSPDGKYAYGESNYNLTYCCDMKTGIEYGVDYKRMNLEESGYFNEAEAQHIRAVLQNSYPFVTVSEMKEWLTETGLDAEFVTTLSRADIISSVQMAIWSFANKNDITADGIEYFATIDIPKNTGIYFTPVHDYTNEMWEWLPGSKTRSFDTRAQYRVNTLAKHLCSLEAVPSVPGQIVISDLEVVKTELINEENGLCHITMYITLNGGNEKDDLKLHATSYSEKADGSISVTEKTDCQAVLSNGTYTLTTHAKDGDKIEITVDGVQHLAKGVYFYDPEGGRDASQSLVGVSEGLTAVSATKDILFIAELASIPVQDIEISEPKLELEPDEKIQLAVSVKPENATVKELEYTSSDDSVAEVDEKGNITAKKEGTAIITVSSVDKPSIRKEITVTVATKKAAPKHYIVFGKTEKIGWYSVSLDGGKTFQTVFGNSNLEVAEGTEMIIRANDIMGDPFTFYINGKAVSADENGYVRVTVDGYMLIGALGIPEVDIPDTEESLNLFQKIIKAFKDFFEWLKGLFS